MGFWKNLFGGGSQEFNEGPYGAQAPGEEYKGFTIRATPMPVGSEFQLSGVVEKTVDGELKVHKFVRADRLSSRDEAVSFAMAKGRQIVDEQGERLFSQSWPKPN